MLKSNLKWAKKNVPQDLKIWKELISEVDWKDVGKRVKEDLKAARDRITDEAKTVAATISKSVAPLNFLFSILFSSVFCVFPFGSTHIRSFCG